MAKIASDRKYTKDHEWAVSKDGKVTVGITDFAQTSLGDVTFVQLPEVGKKLKRGEILGTVESVKAVSDIYSPVSGEVTRVNNDLVSNPAVVNQDPYGKAWLVEMKMENQAEYNDLLTPESYGKHAE